VSIWTKINGFDGRYSMSEDGDFRRNKHTVIGRDGTERVVPKRELKVRRNNGLRVVNLVKPNGRTTQRSVAALLREHFGTNDRTSGASNVQVNNTVEAPNASALLTALAGLDRPVARLIVEFA
jgi:hypothetical protein